MTDDELADAFKANLDELHAKVAALPDGAAKSHFEAWASVAHRALGRIKRRAVDETLIQPFSGGPDDDKPDEP